MKKLMITLFLLSACTSYPEDQLHVEQEFHGYEPEYVYDCLEYEELYCEGIE